MAVNDIYRVTVQQTLHSQMILNTLYYRESVGGVGGGSADLAARVANLIVPLMKAVQSNELTHNAVVVQKIFPAPPTVPATDTSAAGAATVASNSLPTSVASVITKRTAFAGRKYRGRVFLSGVPASSEDDSKVAAGAVAALNALGTILSGGVSAGAGPTYSPIIWHKNTSTFDAVLTTTTQTILRNQRRRQIGKGR
jgi:hypothetical protein